MGIAQIPLPSTPAGLTTSDLITQPQWTLIGSITSTSTATSFTISNIPQTYRSLRVLARRLYSSDGGSRYYTLKCNSGTTSNSHAEIGYRDNLASYAAVQRINDYWYLNSYTTWTEIAFDVTIDNYTTSENKIAKIIVPTSGDVEQKTGIYSSSSAVTSLVFGTVQGTAFYANHSGIGGGLDGIFLYGAK